MQIIAICPESEATYYSESIFIESSDCGTCTDASYCSIQGFSTAAEYINGVLIGSYSSFNGDNGGYGDFTGETIELISGEEIFFSLSPGFPFLEYEEAWRIWIDLDHSGTFEESEVIFQTDQPQTGIVTGAFTLPETTIPGPTRMRIAMSYVDNTSSSLQPCVSFPFGEVEDYCVQINQLSGSSDGGCSFPTALQMIDTIEERSVLLSWSPVDNVESYEIIYQSTDLSFSDIINTTENEILIEGLSNCGTYSMHIKTICGEELSSPYSPAFTFSPLCVISISKEVSSTSDWFVYPNPTTNNFKISIADGTIQDVEISVLSANGKLISRQNKRFSSSQNSLIISSLQTQSAGVYFIKIQTERGTEVLKIIKQ